jgi:carbonic anhydrase
MRRLVPYAVALCAVALAAGVVLAQVQTKESQAATTPAAALQKLQEGNARFVAGQQKSRDWGAKVVATASGQHPFAAVVSCMDSRAPAEIILDQGIGDMFSLRSAGALVDTDVIGGLEFATKVVGAKCILVLGHTECGAVKGAIDGVKLGNLTSLLAKVQLAVRESGAGNSKDSAFVRKVTEQTVRDSMREIRERSSIIRELLDSGNLKIAGGIYDVSTGAVTMLPD